MERKSCGVLSSIPVEKKYGLLNKEELHINPSFVLRDCDHENFHCFPSPWYLTDCSCFPISNTECENQWR